MNKILLCMAIALLSVAKTSVVAVAYEQSAQAGKAFSVAEANEVMKYVESYIGKGDLASALNLLRPYINEPERFPKLYSEYLVILSWTGHYGEAIRLFESLPASVPKRAYLLRNMAKAYFDTKVYHKALKLYSRSLDERPEDEIALQGVVDTLMAMGPSERAESVPQVIADPAGKLSRVLLKARLLIAQSRYNQALDLYDTLIQTRGQEAEKIAKERDDLIAGMPSQWQTDLIQRLKDQIDQGNDDIKNNYILCLALTRRYQEAVTVMATYHVNPSMVSDNKAYWYAWAIFKSGRPAEAEEIFSMINRRNPDYLKSKIGLIYCMAARARLIPALEETEDLLRQHPDHFELLFAKAYIYEKQSRFWDSIGVYDHILRLFPGNETALRLRLHAYSDMGASSVAKDLAALELPQDKVLQQDIREDMGMDLLQWGESSQATDMLLGLREGSQDRLYTYNYMAALEEAGYAAKVTAEYETLEASGKEIPGWVKEIAAGAYADIGEPQRAIVLFDQALEENPRSRDGRLGKFYVLQQMRLWDEAEELLTALEADTPDTIQIDGKEKDNPERFDLAIVRGWFLAHQDRLREADALFTTLHQRAPANVEARNGLAHVHLWRGWPRRALEEFRIIDSLQPDFLPSQPGKLAALDALNEKDKARELSEVLLEKSPRNRHLLKLRQSFLTEQMNVLRTESAAQRESSDIYDIYLRQGFSTPLTLNSRFTTYILWRQTSQDTGGDGLHSVYSFRRAGVGLEYRFNPSWQIDSTLSKNYNDGKDAGVSARLNYTPSDCWSFAAFVDSFSTDIPGRARIVDIKGSNFGVEGAWRQSEWRQVSANYTLTNFSDDNVRNESLIGYQQNLLTGKDWRMRLYLDLYAGWNSKGDRTVYFNPKQVWSLSATHMTEWTMFRRNERGFVHRLYVTLGSIQQKGYSNAWEGSVRYEQEYEFSDRHYLLVGMGNGRSVYDGNAVQDFNFDMVYQFRF